MTVHYELKGRREVCFKAKIHLVLLKPKKPPPASSHLNSCTPHTTKGRHRPK